MPSPYDYMQNRWLEWHEIPLDDKLTITFDQWAKSHARFASMCEEIERERCCKDICFGCAQGYPVERRDEDYWKHLALGVFVQCEATVIRERAWKENNKEDNNDR